jgi:hypothetical protein
MMLWGLDVPMDDALRVDAIQDPGHPDRDRENSHDHRRACMSSLSGDLSSSQDQRACC